MDYSWSQEDQAFRERVRKFIAENWTYDADGRDWGEGGDDAAEEAYRTKLAQAGYLVMAWPKAYGGQDAPYMEQMIFAEESVLAGAPHSSGGASLVGPTLILNGTEEQKVEHLNKIARNEIRWAQGYSEPGAGSDLAGLQTRAVRDGDDFIINGQKIWTSGAHSADWLHVLTRTDPDAPKHRGISYFMMDIKTPGISVRPLPQMNEGADLCETFYEDVRVPAKNMIGEENRGWYVAVTTLDFERSGVDRTAAFRLPFDKLMKYVKDSKNNVHMTHIKRQHLADIAIEQDVARYIGYRVTTMQSRNLIPNYEASMSKVFGSEMIQRDSRRALAVLGPQGALKPKSKYAIEEGEYCQIYMWATSRSILAGTNEIQRNIIATRGLGLPRG